MSYSGTRIDRFIRDLTRVSEKAAAGRVPGRGASNAPGGPVPVSWLDDLTREFDSARSKALGEIGGSRWLSKLPRRDPLRCSVGLFDTLYLGLHETSHTRALAWLLDPGGEHGFKDALLQRLLGRTSPSAGRRARGIRNVSVQPERFGTSRRNRFDIYISWKQESGPGAGQPFELFLEAKIDAEEGEDQCLRYAREADRDRKSIFVFLTPDGRKPTNPGSRPWQTLSFIELMAMFRKEMPSLSHKPGIEFLRLYITGVLKSLYQVPCGETQASLQEKAMYTLSKYLL